ncbi:MAG: 8-oxo-dGTP pyrophosphatase MutT (NUDIX family) [Flavobacteriales bacterium]|jgi:8-oxo-dGTP pyrophosphatase MutT (NUDIX family)
MDLPIKKNPWKIVTTQEGYDNPWIKLTHHDVINPGGNKGEYTTIHFKNLAVGVIPLDQELNTYLVGQYRFPLQQYSWEIPEGGGKFDEEPIETAKRELHEETGINAEDWLLIQEFDISNSISDEKACLFLARDLSFEEAHPDDDEELALKKVPFKQVYQWVLEGKIRDGLTVVAVLKIQTLLLEGKLK